MNDTDVRRFRSYVTCAARWGHVAWAKYYEGDAEMSAAYAFAYHVMEKEARELWLEDMSRPGHGCVHPENWGLVWWLALSGAAEGGYRTQCVRPVRPGASGNWGGLEGVSGPLFSLRASGKSCRAAAVAGR